MDALLQSFGSYGITGLIVFVLIYDVFVLQSKLLKIIESNTFAMGELKNVIQKLVDKHE